MGTSTAFQSAVFLINLVGGLVVGLFAVLRPAAELRCLGGYMAGVPMNSLRSI